MNRPLSTRAALRSLLPYLRPQRLPIAALCLGLVLEAGYEVGVRYSLKFIIDEAVGEGDVGRLLLIFGLLGAGVIVYTAMCLGTDWIWARTGGRIVNAIRHNLFSHLQQLPLAFFQRRASGDIAARFSADAAMVENGLVVGVPVGLTGVTEIALTLYVMASIDMRLCAVAIAGIILCLTVPKRIHARAVAAGFELRSTEGRLSGYVQENLAAQGVVKAYGLEPRVRRDFAQRLDALFLVLSRANFLAYLTQRLPNIAFLLLQLAGFAIGAWLAIQETISVGDLVSFQALLLGLTTAIYNLTWMFPSLIEATAGYQRIREVLDEPVAADVKAGAAEFPVLARAIAFEQVDFSYEPGKLVLHKFSIEIPRGQYLAIVGRSGAGKSTLVGLLLRFIEVDGGRILMDGRDVREASLASLRRQIALVEQEAMLFDLPVAENIRLGREDATDEEVQAAARAAGIHDVLVRLPQGYATSCGESGGRFSGGERQRIALARALVRRPALLVLDEVTAALDATTQAGIADTIESLRGDCTIVAVTHRLPIAQRADRIVVMEAGCIVEDGTHDALIAADGAYARIWHDAGFGRS